MASPSGRPAGRNCAGPDMPALQGARSPSLCTRWPTQPTVARRPPSAVASLGIRKMRNLLARSGLRSCALPKCLRLDSLDPWRRRLPPLTPKPSPSCMHSPGKTSGPRTLIMLLKESATWLAMPSPPASTPTRPNSQPRSTLRTPGSTPRTPRLMPRMRSLPPCAESSASASPLSVPS